MSSNRMIQRLWISLLVAMWSQAGVEKAVASPCAVASTAVAASEAVAASKADAASKTVAASKAVTADRAVGIRSPLIVNEILFAPDVATLEFVEVLNTGTVPIDLAEWHLGDAGGRLVSISPPGVLVAPGAAVALVRSGAAFRNRWPGTTYVEVRGWPILADDGDTVVLEGPATGERVPYERSWGTPGRSIERRDPSGPSDHVVNWGASIDPTGASPGRRNTLFAPDHAGPIPVFAETSSPDRVEAWFDEPVAPGRFFLNGVPAGILLDDGRNRRIELEIPHGTMDPDDDRPPVLRVENVTDLFGNTLDDALLDVALLPRTGDVRLTEVLTAPRVDAFDGLPDGVPFVELAATGSRYVSVRRLRLAARTDENGQRKTSEASASLMGLRPGERAVMMDDLNDGPRASIRFAEAFPSASFHILPVADWPFARPLAPIRLVGSSGLTLDSLDATDDWYPSAVNGRSLERIDPWSSRSGPAAWTVSSDPELGTPTRRNSSEDLPRGRPPESGDVVISEVLYDAGSTAERAVPEFVEFYVTAPYPVDPNGLVLEVGAAESDLVAHRIAYVPDAWTPGASTIASGTSTDAVLRFDLVTTAFPLAAAHLEPTSVLPLPGTLRNGHGVIRLLTWDGTLLDRMVYDDGMHHPALGSTRGISLERVDPLGPSLEPTNWVSSTHVEGATPGYRQRPERNPSGSQDGVTVSPRVFYPGEDTQVVAAAIHARLFSGPGSVAVAVFSLDGRRVRDLTSGQFVYDEVTVYWDGLSSDGIAVPTGPYVVQVHAADSTGHLYSARAVVIVARRQP